MPQFPISRRLSRGTLFNVNATAVIFTLVSLSAALGPIRRWLARTEPDPDGLQALLITLGAVATCIFTLCTSVGIFNRGGRTAAAVVAAIPIIGALVAYVRWGV